MTTTGCFDYKETDEAGVELNKFCYFPWGLGKNDNHTCAYYTHTRTF